MTIVYPGHRGSSADYIVNGKTITVEKGGSLTVPDDIKPDAAGDLLRDGWEFDAKTAKAKAKAKKAAEAKAKKAAEAAEAAEHTPAEGEEES